MRRIAQPKAEHSPRAADERRAMYASSEPSQSLGEAQRTPKSDSGHRTDSNTATGAGLVLRDLHVSFALSGRRRTLMLCSGDCGGQYERALGSTDTAQVSE